MASLSVCMFLSVDYSLPIINRPWQLRYSSDYFYNYCLLVIILLPVSMVLYSLYKKSLGANVLSDRKTMFWTNKKPTLIAVLTGIVATVMMTLLVILNLVGRYSSAQCSLPLDLSVHGEVRPLGQGIGTSVQCHHNYIATPAARVYCRWFFGPEGFFDLTPAYHKDLTTFPDESESNTLFMYQNVDRSLAFVRNMSGINCIERNQERTCLERVTNKTCSVSKLLAQEVQHGKWKCKENICILLCEVIIIVLHPIT